MKKIFLSVVAVWLAVSAFPKTLFETANDFYLAENYKQAAETYMNVVKSGFVSPELYYNLGNSYFRLGNYPNAILYYEKALRLAPKDTEIQMNLGISNTKIKDKFETLPDIFFVRWWKIFTGIFLRDIWGIIFLFLVFATVFSFAWYFYATHYDRKKWAFYLCFALACCSGITVSAAIQQHRIQTRRMGIMMKNNINVSSSPEVNKPKFTVNGGTKVDILDEIGNYYRIRVADGNNGWVAKEELAEI